MTIVRSFAFVAAAAVALLATVPAGAQVRWTLPTAYPVDNFHSENLIAFARDLTEASGGRVAITVHPNATLFPATAIKSAVRIGQAQVGEVLLSLHDNEEPIFGADVVPFLAVSYDEARRLWAASRPTIERKFAAQGLMVLFAVPWPPQGIYSKKEINRISDMKGLSWRVYNAGTQRIAQLVDAYPVTIQAADLPQALATGLINAFISSSATGVDTRAWETMSYFYDAQAWIPKNVTFMNKAVFDQLDRPMQETVVRLAAAAEARGWQRSQERTKSYMDQLAGHGMKVLRPSDSLKEGLQQIGERLTNEWLAKSGADGQAVIDAYRKPSL
jgi:TRAP-type C4-dicarboxylate transport system substrate-binding protein